MAISISRRIHSDTPGKSPPQISRVFAGRMLLVVGGGTALFVLLTVAFIRNVKTLVQTKAATSYAAHIGRQFARAIGKRSDPEMWEFDADKISFELMSGLQTEDINYIRILNQEGTVIGRNTDAEPKGDEVSGRAPIIVNDEEIGSVEVYLFPSRQEGPDFLGYFNVADAASRSANIYGILISRSISRFIEDMEHPEFWTYDANKLSQTVTDAMHLTGLTLIRIRDVSGKILVENEVGTEDAGRYIIRARTPIIINNQVVGSVEVYMDLPHLRKLALYVTSFGVAVLVFMAAFFYFFPVRIVKRLEASMQKTYAELETACEYNEYMNTIVSGMVDALIVLDPDATIRTVNKATLSLLGYKEKELIGQPMRVLFLEEENLFKDDGLKDLVKKGSFINVESILLTKSSHRIAVLFSGSVMRGKDGVLQGVVCLAKDITERKQAEENLRIFMAKLTSSNRDLEQFASIASHDLQEPLCKVKAFGDRLKTVDGGSLSVTGRDYLDRMQGAADRMQVFINNLLEFSRVSVRTKPFVPLDLTKLIQGVLSDLETRLGQVGGEVRVGELATLHADPLQMGQLFQNLIGNALKFRRPGQKPVVKIHGEPLNGSGQSYAKSFTSPNSRYRIFIEDNGIGFEQQYSERIFKIFHRLHGRGDYEGTGVGLAICWKIVERHGGDITARSTPGTGTTFIITLPIKPSSADHVNGGST